MSYQKIFNLPKDHQLQKKIRKQVRPDEMNPDPDHNKLNISVPYDRLNEIKHYIQGMKDAESTLNKKKIKEDLVQQKLPLHIAVKTDSMDFIKQQIRDLQLKYDMGEAFVLVQGPSKQVLIFTAWLFEYTNNAISGQTAKYEGFQEIHLVQEKISLSTFHRVNRAKIFEKADNLNLTREITHDVLLVSGRKSEVHELQSYLQKIEADAKNDLYPKYWDFYNDAAFAEIEVAQDSEEFLMVDTEFKKTMPQFKITKLTRIQNKHLMDQFIHTLHKQLEIRPEFFNRKLLFHGTKGLAPSVIYKDSDSGFDTQYANDGAQGRGLYFAGNASYSHGYRHTTKNNTFQMFFADVYAGRSAAAVNTTRNKAPTGYDSVEVKGANHFIIYDNFRSYPLYLIDYQQGN